MCPGRGNQGGQNGYAAMNEGAPTRGRFGCGRGGRGRGGHCRGPPAFIRNIFGGNRDSGHGRNDASQQEQGQAGGYSWPDEKQRHSSSAGYSTHQEKNPERRRDSAKYPGDGRYSAAVGQDRGSKMEYRDTPAIMQADSHANVAAGGQNEGRMSRMTEATLPRYSQVIKS